MNCKMNIKQLCVALLFVVFGWSSWIDVNGLFIELPVMVHRLPEGWNLPSYFTIIIQLANIGPLSYGVGKFLLNKYRQNSISSVRILETVIIFVIIIVGALATLLLSFYWLHTSVIGGVEHSTVLLVLVFFLSLVDCTSSVTFLPFLSQFKASYITAFYIGEGLSGLLPTIMAFIQGSGEYTCVNATTNTTDSNESYSMQPQYKPLLFPVRDFFLILCVMLALSAIAFSVLRFSKYCKSEHLDISTGNEAYQQERSSSPTLLSNHLSEKADNPPDACVGLEVSLSSNTPILSHQQAGEITLRQYVVLLGVMTFICCLANGVLPAIQIYSLLPYGQIYYSLGVKLSALSNPLACFLGFCAISQNFALVGVLTGLVAASALYILVIASYSPFPPVEGAAAAVVMVVVWVVFTGTVSYLKVYMSSILLKKGHSALFHLGVATQIGSFVGAIISFLCTTILQLFRSAPPC